MSKEYDKTNSNKASDILPEELNDSMFEVIISSNLPEIGTESSI